MTIPAGSVSVDDNGNATGSGASLEYYNDNLAQEAPDLPNPAVPPSDWAQTPTDWATAVNKAIVNVKQGFAKTANGLGTAWAALRDTDLPPSTLFTTTSNTPVDTTIAISDNHYQVFRVTYAGMNTSTGAAYVTTRTVGAKRFSGGSVVVAETAYFSDVSGGPTALAVSSSSNLVLRVAGPNAQTWSWSVSYTLIAQLAL